MGFWDVAGKIGKGALDIAIDVVKELPSAAIKQVGNQAESQLKSNKSMSSEQIERLKKVAERGREEHRKK